MTMSKLSFGRVRADGGWVACITLEGVIKTIASPLHYKHREVEKINGGA